MEAFRSDLQCPRCHSMKMRQWRELSEDQQYLISSLPDFDDLAMAEIRGSDYCTKCWYRREKARETVV